MCKTRRVSLIPNVDTYPQSASASIVAASRLVYAIARDGPIPLHGWVRRVSKSHMPYNAVTVVFAFCATLLCTSLPSPVAFTSLVSACNLLVLSPYGLIALLRLTITPDKFKNSKFYLGRFRHLIYAVAVVFDAFLFGVSAKNLRHLVALTTLARSYCPRSISQSLAKHLISCVNWLNVVNVSVLIS